MIKMTALLMLMLFSISCGQSISSEHSPIQNRQELGSAPEDINLEGQYDSNCTNDHNKSFQDNYYFRGSKVEVKVTNFEGTDCREASKREQFVSTYSFNFDGSHLELTKGQSYYTLYNPTLVSSYNQENGFCDFTNWKENIEKEITNQNCDGQAFVTGEKFIVNVQKHPDGLLINNNFFQKIH